MEEISMHVLDIAENSTRAGSKLVEITITESTIEDTMTIEIDDDGSGMDQETIKLALDPFYTTKKVRRVGLGIPLLAQAARATGGFFSITSDQGKGTRVKAVFRLGHIDRQPLGRMDQTVMTLIAGNPEIDFVYRHKINGGSYLFDTRELRGMLEDVPVNHADVINFIGKNIREGIAELAAKSG
ncbi:MAG: sensor histidine kinase [Syntrophales bacterium]|nr:sensor histidine kinase [Syntrophales bacterium]